MMEYILCYTGAYALGFVSCIVVLAVVAYISDRKLDKEIIKNYDRLN